MEREKLSGHFADLLGSAPPPPDEVLESVGGGALSGQGDGLGSAGAGAADGSGAADSGSGVAGATAAATNAVAKEILERTRENLYRMIAGYLGNTKELRATADRLLAAGGDALNAVVDRDADYPWTPAENDMLEVIVQVNGSRPSFVTRNGTADLGSSPITSWESVMRQAEDKLRKAIACVGRIDLDGRHVGTGFLVGPDLVVTNRHVLQGIADENANGLWAMKGTVTIDFGLELQGLGSFNKRPVKAVVFCGDQRIQAPIDHGRLDMALLLLDTRVGFGQPVEPMPVYTYDAWNRPGSYLFVIGYPGDPGLQGQVAYGNELLDQLFGPTYGCKRVAPGLLMGGSASPEASTFTHDTTTLGGNSGSVMVALNFETAAAGLHYGGSLNAPRQNWGHQLCRVLDRVNPRVAVGTLKEVLLRYGAVVG